MSDEPDGEPRETHPALHGEPVPTQQLESTVNIIQGKGEFLGGGATGLVERLDSGDVVKSAWTGCPTAPDCWKEIAIEAQIYERLGAHRRLVSIRRWDPLEHTLTMEYMPHGSLKEYLAAHGQDVSTARRRQWAIEAAECLELIHSCGVIQSDVGPHNFLLDADLSLKICDFGGSSLDGSPAMVAPGVRYRLPGLVGGRYETPVVQEDLFALGSTIYFIGTGYEPYHEVTDEDEVEKLYKDGLFPDLGGVPFAEAIALCWRQEAESAKMVLELLHLENAD